MKKIKINDVIENVLLYIIFCLVLAHGGWVSGYILSHGEYGIRSMGLLTLAASIFGIWLYWDVKGK